MSYQILKIFFLIIFTSTAYTKVINPPHDDESYVFENALTINAQQAHNIEKRQVRARNIIKEYNFLESKGNIEGANVLSLKNEIPMDTYKITDENQWISVDFDGSVRVKQKWDYEKLGLEKLIDFSVIMRNKENEEIQRILFHIEDVNDEAPYFLNTPVPFQTIVPLNALPNTLVYTLQAKDPDTNPRIRYFITQDRANGRFVVDEISGQVRTKGIEPFLSDLDYVLYVKAEDQNGMNNNARQSTPDTKLSIMGGNRAPQFYLDYYHATIPENHKKDSDVISVKAKSFANRAIKYYLEAESPVAEGAFIIGSTSGIVKLAKELDYEDETQPREYRLSVKAVESSERTTSVELTITITDVNDNHPRFELQDYESSYVDEDIPIGTSILKIKATDRDSGANREIKYRVTDSNFTIDTNGNIFTQRQLDADDNNAYYQFMVIAEDHGYPSKSGSATVRVYTKNKNDEIPEFSKHEYVTNVVENTKPNTVIMTVVATDKDGDTVHYAFANNLLTSGPFDINERTGIIRLNNNHKSFDNDSYQLQVMAMDGLRSSDGKYIHNSTARVNILIIDVNDHKPIFNNCSSYSPHVAEELPIGSSVVKVHATDKDKGKNGKVTYSIVQQSKQDDNKFTIDEQTGEVKTNKVFNREGDDGKFMSVTVKATDHGIPSLESVCTFKVTITDINDNCPIFDRNKYVWYVAHDAREGTNILRVSATDKDSDLNRVINYSLRPSNDPRNDESFEIQPDSGWIILKKKLVKDHYNLTVRATDIGIPPKYAETEVELKVTDIKNKLPVWDQKVYGPIIIKENIEINTVVTSVKARVEVDSKLKIAYEPIYGSSAYTNQNETFWLEQREDTSTGEAVTWIDIIVNKVLDVENVPYYNLTIRAFIKGEQHLASETVVNIELEDVNDVSPRFIGIDKGGISVPENEKPGTFVTQLYAVDKDLTSPNNVVTFFVLNQESNFAKNYFQIDEKNGIITTKVELDREKQDLYELKVGIHDGAKSTRPNVNGPNSATVTIDIHVSDKNDNTPYFNKTTYEAEVEENSDKGTLVLTVTATDADQPLDVSIEYEIVSGNTGEAFAVRSNMGEIYVNNPLDYEVIKKYNLTLKASDCLHENFTNVIINIKDVNDNPPVFDHRIYTTQIMEEDNKNLPKRILQVVATDGDKDRPQNIVYFLTGQGIDPDNLANSKFDINRTTGEIYILKPLDRDQPNGQAQWQFSVVAQDEGGKGLAGNADVIVNLKDINDNAPIFPQGIYYGNATENSTAGMLVMIMTAVDLDDPSEGTNAKLNYSIVENVFEKETGLPIFEIESDTGIIKTAVCCLDREKIKSYSLRILAVDGGGLKGTGTASILVKDINDMPPKFTKDEWYAEVDETDGVNLREMPILTVTVQDEDETNKFQYKVIDGSGNGAEKFTMIRNNDGTGSLKIAQPLDFEDKEQRKGFRFRIQVNDKGENNDNDKYHVAYAWVNVKLRDINDNKPQFVKSNIETTVLEDVEIGYRLAVFEATDLDEGGKSKVSYSIDRSSDRKRQFRIDESGVVTIRKNLDREETPRHQIRILATDDGMPALNATATLTIIVEDVNDNAPRFAENYRPVIMEHTPPTTEIKIRATDDDDATKGNGPPFLFTMDPNADGVIKTSFKVESIKDINGEELAIVKPLKSFDREQQKEYHIPIIISDNGFPVMTATSTLTVVIGDINDNNMEPGFKDILVYNYEGKIPYTQIGRVYVSDRDDWDLSDKKFDWVNTKSTEFNLNKNDGMISMLAGTPDGIYPLRFHVANINRTQVDILAEVTVTIKTIPHAAVINSGSIRISGISEEDFIGTHPWKKEMQSRAEILKKKIATLLNIDHSYVHIFSVQQRRENPLEIDIHFAASNPQYLHQYSIEQLPHSQGPHGSLYYKPMKLNGIISMNRELIEKEVGINIVMVGIDECLYENENCDGSCSNKLKISKMPYIVNANTTALVGVGVNVIAECTCDARNFIAKETCESRPCYNGGKCIENDFGVRCQCENGYDGPQCQLTTRSFKGNGWAWYPPLEMCNDNHLNFEFITTKSDGLMLYNGPIMPPISNRVIVSDFISIELVKGIPRLLIDFGSGTLELKIMTNKSLNDGQWHRLDIFWNTETVNLIVDFCKSVEIYEKGDGPLMPVDRSSCQISGSMPLFTEYLNVNAPLQIGGLYKRHIDSAEYNWNAMPIGIGFDGCIRNLIHNSKLYDLALPDLSEESAAGCLQTDNLCNEELSECWEHGICVGSFTEAKCQCNPGWSGHNCKTPTISATFMQQSYVKYALKFEPDKYSTQIQLSFRTKESYRELFRAGDQYNRKYAILEIENGQLRFRYSLNVFEIEERDIWLSAINVADGQWHTVKVSRYGSVAMLELDGGGGRRFNETFSFEGHQWLLVDKHEGVYLGGKVDYTGVKSLEVGNSDPKGCFDDIRFEEKNLPLPPATNDTKWGYVAMYENLENQCQSSTPCINNECPHPSFNCINLWNERVCMCGDGRIRSQDGKSCIDKDECLDFPCLNGGECKNLKAPLMYSCICPEHFYGANCELVQEAMGSSRLTWGWGAILAIFLCVLLLCIIVLLVLTYSTIKKSKLINLKPGDETIENMIEYNYEGGGEQDTEFDISPLKIPINSEFPQIGDNLITQVPQPIVQEVSVGMFIENQKQKVENDEDSAPLDNFRHYAYEGNGSSAGSLSSLSSGSEPDFNFLRACGPKFGMLADMYGSEDEDNSIVL